VTQPLKRSHKVVITEVKEVQSKANISELSLGNNNSHLKKIEAEDVLS
jgi:hypothetical protein